MAICLQDKESALKSCQLNGTEFDSHVLRVDMAMKDGATSKPMTNGSSTAQHHDQSKSIFLGNLHFGELHYKIALSVVFISIHKQDYRKPF